MYLAVAFLSMGWAHLVLQGVGQIRRFSPRGRRIGLAAVVVTLLPLLTTLTYARNEVWQSELSLWRDAVEKSPHKARPHLNYGRALYLYPLGDKEKAKKEFEIANRLCTSCADPYHNLAFVYRSEGDYRKAIALDLEALKRKPNHRESLYQLGSIHKELEQWQEARLYLERLINQSPGSEYLPAYVDLIAVYLEMGLQAEAVNLAGKLVRMPDTLPQLDYYRGMAFYEMKDFARATDHFHKQTQREAKRVFAYLMLGRIHYEEGDLAQAERAFRQAVKEQRRSAAAHYNLALILEKQGNLQEAVEHLKEAKAADPFSLGKSIHLIKLYGYLGYSAEQYDLVRILLDLRSDSKEFSFIKANGDRNLNSALRGYSETFLAGDPSPPAEKARAIIAALKEDYPKAIFHYHTYLQSVSDQRERGRIERELHRLETILGGGVPLEIQS
jgi:tetratricopeptide (TPR) repeat protein